MIQRNLDRCHLPHAAAQPDGDLTAGGLDSLAAVTRRFWAERLAALPHVHNLPLDRQRPARLRTDMHAVQVHINAATWDALQSRFRAFGIDAATAMQSLLAVWIARESGECDVVVLLAGVAGGHDVDSIGGLLLRHDVARDQTLATCLHAGAIAVEQALEHVSIGRDALQVCARAPLTPAHAPLAQVVLAWAHAPVSWLSAAPAAVHDVRLSAQPGGAGLVLDWEFSVDLFEPDGARRLAAHFAELLRAVACAEDETCVWQLSMMDAAERYTVLYGWNATEAPFAAAMLHELFTAQATRTPEAIALSWRENDRRYGDLDADANRLAHHLRSLGIGPGCVVGVCMARSIELVTGLLAISKAGAAYVPLDPNYPQDRVAFMLADSGAACVLAGQGTRALAGDVATVVLDDPGTRAALATYPDHAPTPLPGMGADALAYIIYTSGSTGVPKGVCIEHRHAAAMIDWARRLYDDDALSGVIAATSICFDLSIFELFVPLASGGRAIIVDNALDVAGLRMARGARLINTVPSAIKVLVEEGELPVSVRIVNLAGEALPPSLVRAIYRCEHVEAVYNLYGPSEDTTYSTWALIARDAERVPIGRPLSNGQCYVLDAQRQPVPIGVAGEIYVAGAGVARGYWNRPELTGERFLTDPFAPVPARMYRTGDLGRWLANGQLEFLGRTDHQIKLRGFRIELGEIQERLIAINDVHQALVMAREDSRGDQQLVAYVVPADPAQPAAVLIERCRARLAAGLPEYMVPASFVVLAAMPLTPNGKIDRAALPAPEFVAAVEYVEPATPLERDLAQLWRDTLKLPRSVGAIDDFFALGGHSLLATRLLGEVQLRHGTALPLKTLFDAPTLREFAMRVARGHGSVQAPLVPVARNGEIELTYMQRQMWFIRQLDETSAHYHMQSRFELSGAFDAAALRQALREVMQRHESLRTVVALVDECPVQRILAQCEPGWHEVDLRACGPDAERATRDVQAREDAVRPFDLERDPMLRATVLHLPGERWELLLNLHHIAGDGWSLDVLMHEVGVFYRAARAGVAACLEPLPVQYADYSVWRKEVLRGETLESLVEYWAGALDGMPTLHRLPLDRPRQIVPSLRGGVHRQHIDAALVGAFRQLCRRHRATLSMGLHTVFAILLARHSGERDIVVGAPVANREQPEVAGLIGLFTNTVAMRTRLDTRQSFVALLGRHRQTALDAYAHQQIPFEHLVERLQLPRDVRHTTMFQILFALQNTQQAPLSLGPEVATEPLPPHVEVCPFELSVEAFERDDGLALDWMYRLDLFDPDTIGQLVARFERLLQAVTAEPERDLWTLPMLAPPERDWLLHETNATAVAFPSRPVHEALRARTTSQPDAPAVIDGTRVLSYAQLDRQSDIAADLLRARGAGPGRLVALALDRGIDLIVASLAVLKTGAAYLPIDPAYPRARIDFLLANSGALLLLATRSWTRGRNISHAGLVAIDEAEYRDWCVASDTSLPQVSPQDAAYLIYTSGSTGEPKGVLNSHAGLANLCAWHTGYFATEPGSRSTLLANVAFDAIVLELWPALLAGACVVVVDDDTRADPSRLAALLREQRISHCFLPTGLLEVMAEFGGLDSPSLQVVSCGGDRLQRHCLPAGSVARLVNLYGPTEATVLATAHDVQRDTPVLIGKPIANVQAHVLNHALEPQPVGVVGELFLGGACVGLGYLDAPGLTEERFIDDPFSPDAGGARLYRTGDLARRKPDGSIDFVGRIDQQVKLRGFRIELGEIENRISAVPGVQSSIVLVREDEPGRKILVGYVTLDSDSAPAPTVDSLHAKLRASLPDHMVPQALVVLHEMPLTRSGKIDRDRLPVPDVAVDHDAQPFTETEKALAVLWGELLNQPGIGVNQDFFQAGGHSLLIARMIHCIATRLGLQVSVRDVLRNPTICELAAQMDLRSLEAALPAGGEEETFPLSNAQFRIWYVEQANGASNAHNVSCAIAVRGALDVVRLQRALHLLVARHPMLRAAVRIHDGVPFQQIASHLEVPIEQIDLRDLSEAEREARLAQQLAAQASHVFDIQQSPLLRVLLVRVGNEDYRLQLNVHHLVFDGWSFALLLQDWFTLYDALEQAGTALPPEPSHHYAGFVRRSLAWRGSSEALAQERFWRDYLADPGEQLNLAAQRRWPKRNDDTGSRRVAVIHPDLRTALLRLARNRRCSLFAVLYSGFALLLGRLAGQGDFNIGVPVNGRHVPGVQGIIGNFLNNLPVRNRLDWAQDFGSYLDTQFANLSAVLSHQDLPFERILELASGHHRRDVTPLFQVFFNMFSQPLMEQPRSLALALNGGAEVEPKFDLTLYVADDDEGRTELTAQFNRALFAGAAIEHLLNLYVHLLTQVSADSGIACGAIDLRLPDGTEQDVASPQRFWPGPVHRLFERQALARPDAIALDDAGQHWTYAELLQGSLHLAQELRVAGVQPGDTVAIVAARNASLVRAVLATLHAGAAFTLLNPEYPPERVAQLARIAAPAQLLYAGDIGDFDPALIARLSEWPQRSLPRQRPSPGVPCSFVSQDCAADAPACITFTSGTSGIPKAVAGVHIGLSGYLSWVPEWLDIEPQDRFCLLSGLGHDPIQRDIFTPLCMGARLVIPPPEALFPETLASWFATQGITFAHLTPAMTQILCSAPDALPQLRVAFLTGEALHYERVAALRLRNPRMRVLNSYGTTETQRAVTYFEVADQVGAHGIVPAREAVPDTVLRVLNASGRPCGLGEVGEVYMESHHLSHGYRNDTELTARVFSTHADGVRRYRTGDMGCRLPAAEVGILGRRDQQLNLRGFRVETGEIEAQVRGVPHVRDAAVIAVDRKDVHASVVAYAVAAPGENAGRLRAAIAQRCGANLPAYMVPAAIVMLERLPLTPNGKLDRGALPPPDWVDGHAYEAPTLPLESDIAEVWAELLKLERVGVHDDFFALGGHSMLQLLLLTTLRKRLGIAFHPRQILPCATVREQAAALVALRG